jgi:hypothetical protein
VDDTRTAGNDMVEAQMTLRRVASVMNWLGLQDAAQKHRDPTRSPGPWADSVIQSEGGIITISVGLERWIKAKAIIEWIHNSMIESDSLDHKQLESYWGYLIFLALIL